MSSDVRQSPFLVETLEDRRLLSIDPVPVAIVSQLSSHSFLYDASDSRVDATASVAKVLWRFGDGQRAYGSQVVHTYASTTTFIFTLTVTDTANRSSIHREQLRTGDTDHTASISGRLFEDSDQDRTKDPRETWRAGHYVWLDDDNNGLFDQDTETLTQSDSGGTYYFLGLAGGTYHVRQYLGDQRLQTSPGRDWTVILADGQAVTGRNFGAVTLNAITGRVMLDKYADGKTDAPPDTTVRSQVLWIDADADGRLDAGEQTATSDPHGKFTFRHVANGQHSIRIKLTGNQLQVFPKHDAATVVNVSGSAILNIKDVLITTYASVTGAVFDDVNANRLADAGERPVKDITLYVDLDVDGRLDATEPSSKTDSRGRYSFSGLYPGNNMVRLIPPKGYASISSGPSTYLSAGANDDGKVLITNRPYVKGQVYVDANGTGVMDNGDPSVNGLIYVDLNDNGTRDTDDPFTYIVYGGGWSLFLPSPGTFTLRVVPDALSGAPYEGVKPADNRIRRAFASGSFNSGIDFIQRRVS